MCMFGNDVPDAPAPPPPPPPDPVFQPGSAEDTGSANATTAVKKGKDALKTPKVDSGLNIPTGG